MALVNLLKRNHSSSQFFLSLPASEVFFAATPMKCSKLPGSRNADGDSYGDPKKKRKRATSKAYVKKPPTSIEVDEFGSQEQVAETAAPWDKAEALADARTVLDDALEDETLILSHPHSEGCLPFGLVASALGGVAGPMTAARAMMRLVRHTLESTDLVDAEAELLALLQLLLGSPDTKSRAVPMASLWQAASSALNLAEPAEQLFAHLHSPQQRIAKLAQAALSARRRQAVLATPRAITVADVAAALRDHGSTSQGGFAGQPSASARSALQQLLASSKAEASETAHLVRVLNGWPMLPRAAVLRGLAHGIALATTEPPFAGGESVSRRTQATVMLEEALLKALGARCQEVTPELVHVMLSSPGQPSKLSSC